MNDGYFFSRDVGFRLASFFVFFKKNDTQISPVLYFFADLITFMSFKFFIELIEGYPVPFAVNYTVGNILALGASWFLCGPRRQFRNMFDQNRKFTSIAYLSCLGGTLAVVFVPLPWAIRLFTLILLLITQFCASFWYSLSYVPYGRRTVTRMLKRAIGMNDSSPSEGWVSLSGLTGRGGTGGEES